MVFFIQELRKLFLTAIEEVLRIFGVIWPYMNAVVIVSGMATFSSVHIIIYIRREIKKIKADDDVSILGARGPPGNGLSRFLKLPFEKNNGCQGS